MPEVLPLPAESPTRPVTPLACPDCSTPLSRWSKGQWVCPECCVVAPTPPPDGAALTLPIRKPTARWPGVDDGA